MRRNGLLICAAVLLLGIPAALAVHSPILTPGTIGQYSRIEDPIYLCDGACPSWGHSPTGIGIESVVEIDGAVYADSSLTVAGGLNIGADQSSSGWCVANVANTKFTCTTAAPVLVEVDPQVGTLTGSKLCYANAGGTAIDCTSEAPSLTPWTSNVNAAGYDFLLNGVADPDTYIHTSGANTIDLVAGGATTLSVNATGTNTTGTIAITGAHGETGGLQYATTTLTFAANPGDASKTASALIPAGAYLMSVATRVNVAGTNCTSFSIGDGTDADLWGNNISPASHTTTTNATATANWSNPLLAAGDVKITANGGNCFDLVIRITVAYMTFAAPTAD